MSAIEGTFTENKNWWINQSANQVGNTRESQKGKKVHLCTLSILAWNIQMCLPIFCYETKAITQIPYISHVVPTWTLQFLGNFFKHEGKS